MKMTPFKTFLKYFGLVTRADQLRTMRQRRVTQHTSRKLLLEFDEQLTNSEAKQEALTATVKEQQRDLEFALSVAAEGVAKEMDRGSDHRVRSLLSHYIGRDRKAFMLRDFARRLIPLWGQHVQARVERNMRDGMDEARLSLQVPRLETVHRVSHYDLANERSLYCPPKDFDEGGMRPGELKAIQAREGYGRSTLVPPFNPMLVDATDVPPMPISEAVH